MADFAQLSIEVDSKGVTRAHNELGRFTKTAKGTETATGKLGAAFKRAVIAMGGFLIVRKLIRLMVEFSTALAEVASISNEVAGNMDDASDQLRRFSKFGKGATESAKGLYQVISAGVTRTADAFQVLEVSTKASIAGLTQTAIAVDVITSALNAYGVASDQALAVSDVLFTAVREGKTTFNELAGSLGRALAISAQSEVSFEELTAAVTALTKGGISTDEAVTGIRATMVSLLKPTKDASTFAKQLGVEFSANALKAKGLGGILLEVKDAVKGDAAALARLFPNVRALAAVMALAGGQSEEFVKQIENMGEAAGATDKAFKIMADTIGFESKRLGAESASLALNILDAFEPIGKVMLKTSADAVEAANTFGIAALLSLRFHSEERNRLALLLTRENVLRRKLAEAAIIERQEAEKLKAARQKEVEAADLAIASEKKRLSALAALRKVDEQRHASSVTIIEDLLSERRELELTSRELLEFNMQKIDATEGARLRALAIFDETDALRKQRDVEREVAAAVDGTTQSEQQLLDLIAKLQTALVKGIIPSYKQWEKLHNSVSNALENLGKNTKVTESRFIGLRATMETAAESLSVQWVDALFDVERQSELTFAKMAEDFAKMVAKMLLQQAILEGVRRAFSSRGASVTGAAQGAAFSRGRETPLARGGVVTRPTLFPMANGAGLMGEAGPEAVMPLTRTSGGDLGVKAEGLAPVVSVNIINNTGEVVTESRRSSAQGMDIDVVIGESVKQHINRGTLDDTMQSRFGLLRRGTSR